MADVDADDCIVWCKSVEAKNIKVVITNLRSIMTQANLVFQEDGIFMEIENEPKNILVQLVLEAAKFNEYRCARKFTCGFDTEHLSKLMEGIGNDDTVTMYVPAERPEILGLVVHNEKTRLTRVSELTILDSDEYEPSTMPSQMYRSIYSLPSALFQKEISKLVPLSRKVEIRGFTDRISLHLQNTYLPRHSVTIDAASSGAGARAATALEQGIFAVQQLNHFVKCTPLSETVELQLANDKPLILTYNVGDLGLLRFALKPCE